MRNFANFLEEKASRLVVYDFDGTLFHSPDKEKGEEIYFQATGQPWPFLGWWGRRESLLPPVVPSVPGSEWFVSKVLNKQRADMAESNTTVVLMTGRPYKLRQRVLDILGVQGLRFDGHFFSGQPGSTGSDTLDIKKNHLRRLITPETKVLEMYDDRDDQIIGFRAFADDLMAINPDMNVLIHDAKKSY